MSDYYNEWDQYCVQWLRNLIDAGHIPAGDVDERSIVDVRAEDLRGYRRCHFFCGIAGWPYALRLAGWPAGAEVWTGSCPCQPLSCAGQRKGDADERHLWPAFFHLIAERRPATVFGEQVSGKDGLEWLSAVRADLEGIGYAVGAADLPACSVGAPHIRRRLFWVAHAMPAGRAEGRSIARDGSSSGRNESFELANSSRARLEERQEQSTRQECTAIERSGDANGSMERATGEQMGLSGRAREQGSTAGIVGPDGLPDIDDDADGFGIANGERSSTGCETAETARHRHSTIAANWDDLEWLPCIDGKWRPTKPGLFPLAHGVSFKLDSGSALEGKSRVGMLRASGNANVPQVAAEFIKAAMECIP